MSKVKSTFISFIILFCIVQLSFYPKGGYCWDISSYTWQDWYDPFSLKTSAFSLSFSKTNFDSVSNSTLNINGPSLITNYGMSNNVAYNTFQSYNNFSNINNSKINLNYNIYNLYPSSNEASYYTIYEEDTEISGTDSEDEPITFTFYDVPRNPISDGILTIEARGDLDDSGKYLTIYAENQDGIELGLVYADSDSEPCEEFNRSQLIISKEDLKIFAQDRAISFVIQTSPEIDYDECDVEARLILEYKALDTTDNYYLFDQISDTLSSGSSGGDITITFTNVPNNPASYGTLFIWAFGDLNKTNENVTVYAESLDGQVLGVVYDTEGFTECLEIDGTPIFNEAQIMISNTDLLNLTEDQEISFVLEASSMVDSLCEFQAYVRLQYDVALINNETHFQEELQLDENSWISDNQEVVTFVGHATSQDDNLLSGWSWPLNIQYTSYFNSDDPNKSEEFSAIADDLFSDSWTPGFVNYFIIQ